MDVTILSVDPIGEAKVEKVSSFLDVLKEKWASVTNTVTSVGTNVANAGKISILQATKFLFMSLDGLIVFADGLMEKGPDKKATVLAAFATLYDYVMKKNIPLWLKPFAGPIKSFVVTTVASLVIDWIVAKYKDGSWVKKDDDVSSKEKPQM